MNNTAGFAIVGVIFYGPLDNVNELGNIFGDVAIQLEAMRLGMITLIYIITRETRG